jgi:hypothetical protein
MNYDWYFLTKAEKDAKARPAGEHIRQLMRQSPSSLPFLTIGKELWAIHERLGKSHFKEWLQAEIGLPHRVAREYMRNYLLTIPGTPGTLAYNLGQLTRGDSLAMAIRADERRVRHDAATQAVALLRGKLGSDWPEFQRLHDLAGARFTWMVAKGGA